MPVFAEMDRHVTLADQLAEQDGGPVLLINKFDVAPGDVAQMLAAWEADAAFFRRQPGFISTQLHRGIAGSGVFLNIAQWESVAQFRAAFAQPEFRSSLAAYPQETVIAPHLFRKLAVPGICVA
ncbi:antibiotic biosynthesis monooxygenase [Oceanicella sp. SM1341]|uniref:antibiotic biosynthesis monooxygenase family protein n=1 Tax=Oceanicella sp. SM1341 TaxID=1548889 RepID=UPI000E4ADACF|nr:antibiotic biosynthesis monooxygenase family protein [Oceanicella sp. SM1341]